jgi:hypothetical protein
MGRAFIRIRLRPDGGFRFRPGQFAFVSIPGVVEAPFSPFSSADGEASVDFIAAKNGAERPFADLKPGETAGIRGPHGKPFSLDAFNGRDFWFLSDTTGIAAARPLLIETSLRPVDQGRTLLSLLSGSGYDAAFVAKAVGGLSGIQLMAEEDVLRSFSARETDPARAVALLFLNRHRLAGVKAALVAAGFSADSIFGRTERRMACGTGQCRLCAAGSVFTCVEGPILPVDRLVPEVSAPGAA